MNGEDEEDGEQSFFAVDDEHRVERPPREEMRKERRKPHGITGATDDDHAPEDRPVVELLPIGIAFEGGLGAETKEPAEVGEHVFRILPVGHHGGGAPEDALLAIHDAAGEDFLHMESKGESKHDGTQLVEEENGAESAHFAGQPPRPDALAEAQRQTGGRQSEEGSEQHRVHGALRASETDEETPGFGCGLLVLDWALDWRFQNLRHGVLLERLSSLGRIGNGSTTMPYGSRRMSALQSAADS